MEGRYEDAIRLLERDLALSRQHGDMQGVTGALDRLAQFALELGRPSEAEAPAREAVRRCRDSWEQGGGVAAGPLTETLALIGSADAATVLDELQSSVLDAGLLIAEPQLLRARAVLHTRNGAIDAAVKLLWTSAELARAQGDVMQQARSQAI